MLTLISRTLVRAVILSSILLAGTSVALAQVPQSTPRPSPPPGDPTRPPGQDPIPGTTPTTQNPPTAPPGTTRTNPTTPPGTTPGQTQPPAATQTPAPTGGEVTGPIREPVIPQFQPRPLPPIPSLQRLGVGTGTIPLTLNDAIKRALENNNDIEIARDDVRIAETQLRALEGIFDPVLSITPQYDKRISPQQSSLGGSGQTGTTSTTTYSWNPGIV